MKGCVSGACQVQACGFTEFSGFGAAIEVHRAMGPGLLESIYEKCLMRELELRGVAVSTQVPVSILYKGLSVQDSLKVDMFVDSCLVIELKAVEQVLPIHKAQVFSYMKLLDAPLGLLLNFHATVLKRGIHRMILPGADMENVSF